MEQLTDTDVQELTEWFGTPSAEAGRLAAQRYEPRASAVYEPTTDYRLENMISRAGDRGRSKQGLVKRRLDLMAKAPRGRVHFEVLRLAFGPPPASARLGASFRFPEVAIVTQAVLVPASEAARHDEHVRLLEVAQRSAAVAKCSPISIAIRVLETDATLEAHGFVVTDDMVRASARRLLERAVKADNVELVVAAKLEMSRLVEEAGDAYRQALAAVRGARHADRAEVQWANAARLEQSRAEKRAKEAERFESKLRRAS